MSATRSYSKEKKKSKPVGIRYNLKKFNTAISRSGEKTVQGLFDFLLDWYISETGGILTPHIVQQANLGYVTPAKALLSQYDAYEEEINKAGTIEELNRTASFIERDKGLKEIERRSLLAIGEKRAKDIQY